MALNPKQERFCNEYLVDYNATQAAIRAGYSKKTAYVIAAEILSKKEVQEYLSAKKTILADQLSITQERTMQEIGRIAFQDVRKFYKEDGSFKSIHELDDDAAAVLAGFDVEEIRGEESGTVKKIRRWDKTKALEMLAKHYNLFKESEPPPVQFNFNNLTAEELNTLLALRRKMSGK
jgi:phage terminase small subunit